MQTALHKDTKRADYASTKPQVLGAWVASVEPGSPADDAGIEPGMRIDAVNDVPLRDIIDWRWEADGNEAELVVWVPEEEELYGAVLYRQPGQDWGIEFTDVLFDGIRTCVNACQFCFMAMLPDDARASLSLRDDDYRLSFLQGNFVTLTNVSDDEVDRIIDCRLEPMNVSLHAISPEVRCSLIGRHAQRGIDVLERLLEAGIEVHGQIVLCAGINDGDELRRTLDWVEKWPSFTSLALVPMGYTKYSRRFSSSFSEDQEASRKVIRMLEPYQARARRELGITRFQLSDEFYLDADLPVPPADTYDGYPQFYDGIGMLRSFLDEAHEVCLERRDDLARISQRMQELDRRMLFVCGEAAAGVIEEFCCNWAHTLGLPKAQAAPYAIRNNYYGGDVNVTGLIVSCDLLAQLPADLHNTVVVLPEAMFNFDHMTLDGDTQQHIVAELTARGATVRIAQTAPHALLDVLLECCGTI
ncbi:MAG: DUF512 domain-containing protein [Atopobiaceae bacterium]|nr:DUF512 domain-containing protein [Atopobiaceae bacterium]